MTVDLGTLLPASRFEAGFARIQQIASAQHACASIQTRARLAMTVHPGTLLAASRFEGRHCEDEERGRSNNAKLRATFEGDVVARRSRR